MARCVISRLCGWLLGERANLCQPAADDRLHPTRRVPVQLLRGLAATSRRLLLLHHAVDDRIRRLRAGDQPRLVALTEERRVRPVPGVRSRADRHVLQLDAGGGQEQVSTAWTQAWPHRLNLRARGVYHGGWGS